MELTIFLSLIALAIVIAVNYLIAGEFANIAEEKGFEPRRYWHFCFWLPFAGYAIVIALPNRKLNELSKALANLKAAPDDDKTPAALEQHGTVVRPESNEQILQRENAQQEIVKANEQKQKKLEQAIASGDGVLAAFVDGCQGIESAITLKEMWQSAGISKLEEYGTLTEQLDKLAYAERFYGKNSKGVQDFITSIQNMLQNPG